MISELGFLHRLMTEEKIKICHCHYNYLKQCTVNEQLLIFKTWKHFVSIVYPRYYFIAARIWQEARKIEKRVTLTSVKVD